jgi:Predicted ATPase of the PP-loop superfamily implicated in cell cycle control
MLLNLDKNKSYLLAVSGGIDSMVMANIFLKSGYHFSVAHCNFQLRNNESDQDALFVDNWCKQNGINIHILVIDTLQYAATHHLSVQEAAREIRYDFFAKLCQEHSYDIVCTAHHADDS